MVKQNVILDRILTPSAHMAALKTKAFRLDDSLIEALAAKSEILKISESEIVRKALICFLGIKFDNDCAAYDELQQVKSRLNNLIKHLNITEV